MQPLWLRGREKTSLAIEAELGERFVDVLEGAVVLGFGRSLDVGIPAPHEFLHARDIDEAIVQEPVEPRHVPSDEASVLPHRVATERRGSLLGVLAEKFEDLGLGVLDEDGRSANLIRQPTFPMVFRTPFVHGEQNRVRLMDDEIGTFSDHLEVAIGDEGCNFQDPAPVGVEAGHFEIDPHEWAWAVHEPADDNAPGRRT